MQIIAAFLADIYATMTWIDGFDIFIVAFFLYYFLTWLQQKTSRSVLIAVTPVVLLFMVSHVLRMPLTARLFEMGFTAIAIALVVIFQEDFRRMYESLASWSLWLRNPQSAPKQRIIDVLVECFSTFSATKTGALVVLKGRQSLEPHTRGGVPVNGTVSAPLLYSIFDHHSPGHDGGVTIAANRIERLGVHLPLSRNLQAVGRLGTRHAAALGLAERCDALVLCASEETGHISLAHAGKISQVESPEELRRYVERYFDQLQFVQAPVLPTWKELARRHWRRKAVSIGLALGLWVLVAKPAGLVQQTFDIPVVYRSLPDGWEAQTPFPERVRVTFSGTEARLRQMDANRIAVSLDLTGVREGVQQLNVDTATIALPPRISIKRIEPHQVTVRAQKPARAVASPHGAPAKP